MACPTHEDLTAYAAADLDPSERAAVEAHLRSGCPDCGRELAAIAGLRRLTSPVRLEDPPTWVLERAARIPREGRDGSLAALLGRMADLVVDTLRDPLPQGARAAAALSRQMLYRALDYDIDVRVTPAAGSRVRISGQVLPGPDRPLEAVAGVEVLLAGAAGAVALSATNELGEFAFEPVEGGEYSLYVDVAEDILRAGDFAAN
jgi:anti-sigma factor RsiW